MSAVLDDVTLERFMRKISIDAVTECWTWTGATTPKGYPKLRIAGVTHYAHRLSWTSFRGPIPNGLQIDHLCRNRPCVNPDHLEPVTATENLRRSSNKVAVALQTNHCINGHEFTEENTRRTTRTQKRVCVTCALERSRISRAKRKAQTHPTIAA